MTQREMFNVMVAIVNDMDSEVLASYMAHVITNGVDDKKCLIDAIDARLTALDKKRTSSDKPSKKQLENEGIYDNVLAIMADGITRTVRQITENYNSLNSTDFSTNRLQPQITKAVKNGDLTRNVIKGTVYFTKAVAPTIDGTTIIVPDDLPEE